MLNTVAYRQLIVNLAMESLELYVVQPAWWLEY